VAKLEIYALPAVFPGVVLGGACLVQFHVVTKGFPPLDLEAHIWPSNSTGLGYKLGGGKVAERQGFYFYRNDRLIQAGGWNKWRESDAEPHSSLARVKINIDLAPNSDTTC
jgi:hypothetical protein